MGDSLRGGQELDATERLALSQMIQGPMAGEEWRPIGCGGKARPGCGGGGGVSPQ